MFFTQEPLYQNNATGRLTVLLYRFGKRKRNSVVRPYVFVYFILVIFKYMHSTVRKSENISLYVSNNVGKEVIYYYFFFNMVLIRKT